MWDWTNLQTEVIQLKFKNFLLLVGDPSGRSCFLGDERVGVSFALLASVSLYT